MERGRWNFSLRDVLVAMVALGVCFALFAHWVEVTREKIRQDQCANNLKQLACGIHNHHDHVKRLPSLTSTQLYDVSPGSLGSAKIPRTGYGWGAQVMPYFCDGLTQYCRKEMQLPAFSGKPLAEARGRPLWSVERDYFHCPSYSGPRFATAPEYLQYSGIDASGKPFGVVVSNYVALTASQLACVTADPNTSGNVTPDGILVPGRGLASLTQDIPDGLSNTFMLCETRESAYSSWYDGTVGWVVAADPNGPEPTKVSNGFWVTAGGTSIQVGPNRATPQAAYLPASKLSTIKTDRKWGPSSEHRLGVVNHAMGDASVRPITSDIDPTLYLQLTTRAGREPVTVP